MINEFGKILILFGAIFIFFGVLFSFQAKIPFFGKLPGDIYIKKENLTFYFPLGSSLIFSFIFSLIFYIVFKFFK